MTHPRRISVVGLGYVGLPMAVAFARTTREVGLDVNPVNGDRFIFLDGK